MSVIRVDYDNVRRQTQKLQAATDNCDKVVRKLKTHIGQLYSFTAIGKESLQKLLSVLYKQEFGIFRI